MCMQRLLTSQRWDRTSCLCCTSTELELLHYTSAIHYLCVCMVYMKLVTAKVLCARYLDSFCQCQCVVCMCECMVFITLITAIVLCVRSQDSLMSVSLRRVCFVFSITGFKGGRKQCCKTPETAALRRGIQQESSTYLGSNSSHLSTTHICLLAWGRIFCSHVLDR